MEITEFNKEVQIKQIEIQKSDFIIVRRMKESLEKVNIWNWLTSTGRNLICKKGLNDIPKQREQLKDAEVRQLEQYLKPVIIQKPVNKIIKNIFAEI